MRVLPAPLTVIAPQPVIETPPSVKLTEPVGAEPVTDAVKVTFVLTTDGLAELDTVVCEPTLLTTCDSGPLAEAMLLASPP